ncbi:hypothetical protein E4U37_004805 [Claviceps purpurea]|nr:hypothetical protein E4U37_004805 [Claviceps purpurea]
MPYCTTFDLIGQSAFDSGQKWCWRTTNLTVPDYSAAEAVQDVLRLVAGGADVGSQNDVGYNPL